MEATGVSCVSQIFLFLRVEKVLIILSVSGRAQVLGVIQ